MAFMNKEKKAIIAKSLKALNLPKHIKYSLRVENYSTLVMTIRSSDIDFMGEFNEANETNRDYTNLMLIHSTTHDSAFIKEETKSLIREITKAIMKDNHDRSDVQTDYFDVGFYAHINIGSWNKPFICTSK